MSTLEERPHEGHLVTLTDPAAPAAEAYRALASSIRFGASAQMARSLLVTSAGQGEGKSTTVANLAVTAAQSGAKVIAIDCNLHQPALHRLFGLPNSDGISTSLSAEYLEAVPLQPGPTPGLQILVAGPTPPTPSQLLGSARFDEVVALLREKADMILIDSPALESAADAILMAPRVDGVLLLISANHTRRDAAQRARDRLARVQARVVGTVLVNAPTRRG
ncbi:MAG TPA: CpsD/CapB family tyrosine-protein kinase [Chloroflexota bacterium]|jgi:non-specific protein-tyrosine kinase